MTAESVTADDVVRAARAYLGVRWVHQGRSVRGLDCIGLVMRVARDLALSDFETRDYGRIPDGRRLREGMREHCIELPAGTEPAHGMVALMSFEADPQHLAIVADYVHGGCSLVHALALERRVVEHRLDQVWANRIVALYRLPGVA